jgi:MazG family protein
MQSTQGRKENKLPHDFPDFLDFLDFPDFLDLNVPMSEKFNELVAVMARLRAPGGCPWDREQTYGSLAQYLLEEAYETFDAIQEADSTGDVTNLKEELGDLLLQVVFHATIGAERGEFTIEDVADGIARKLILRHPHVFGDAKIETAEAVLDNWDTLRRTSGKPPERRRKRRSRSSTRCPCTSPPCLRGSNLPKRRPRWASIGRKRATYSTSCTKKSPSLRKQ